MEHYVITIARGYGSGGKTIGQMLSKELGIEYYDKDLIKIAAEESGINEGIFGTVDEKVKRSFLKKKNDITSADRLFEFQSEAIRKLADKETCIIVGRCADYILKDRKDVIRVFIWADHDACVREVMERFEYTEKEASRKIEAIDKERSEYYKYHTGNDWYCATNYDLCLNSGELGFNKIIDIIKGYLEIRSK